MIITIDGPAGTGKSTVAQALAEQLPESVHVRGDLFRRMVVNGRVDMGSAAPPEEAIRQLRLRYDLACLVEDRYAEAGFQVIFAGDPAKPVRYLLVWITKLPQESAGRFKVGVSEISVRAS